MSITFQDRERAFEAVFVHDAEFRFRLTARRDKLFAAWAAARLHLSAEATAALQADVLAISDRAGADGNGHDAALLTRIGETMALHRRTPARGDLTMALAACAEEARLQLMALPLDHSDAA